MATIFTKIINGDIPSYQIAEDENHFAFLDINPIAEGHTLVVTKQETDYFFDLKDEQIRDAMKFAKKIAKGIDEALSPLRTGIIVQGLEVPHAHIHLVPLYTKTQPMALGHNVKVSEDRMEEIATKISDKVNR
ncbi:HIT family protein [Balneolaceae bacterium YR4-1]|uniref:HIT family protein n=1 Tax=Halalkalibaculum roseum TaxID=2709311 RepID=A0A6M1SWF3_9BACT|nr:HIT family protein [Halalkalibaculum roseum]NGP75364.1 HIT family protein [Halalkalibaculum roseum]